MSFCENVTTCTADECTDFLCFDYTTGILTTNTPDDGGITAVVSLAYCAIRVFQLWLGSLYWQKERELLSVTKGNRDCKAIQTQTLFQLGRSVLSTLGFYLLIQQSLYLFVALIFLDTLFVPLRLIRLQKKDNTHPVQNVLVDLWHLYDEAASRMDHGEVMTRLNAIVEAMRKIKTEEGILDTNTTVDKRRPYLSF